jgi:hypothetical protein
LPNVLDRRKHSHYSFDKEVASVSRLELWASLFAQRPRHRQTPQSDDRPVGAGAGIEAKVTQDWSVKLEYLYLAMPTITTADFALAATSYTWNDSAHIFRVGGNYHF